MAIEKIGPYKIDRLVGRGGMGAVYLARHETTQAEVAVKLLAAHYADDEHFRIRFNSEIETLLKLDHPNIVRLLGHGQEGGQLFFAMEYVDGKSLHEIQRDGKIFDWREVLGIAKQIGKGLRHAHDRGVIHRDLKPGNLLMAEDGTIKLTDFGIAKFFGGRQITAAGGVIGTADFMAPEQLTGTRANARTDIYSLGTVLYTLLARRPPFSFSSVAEAVKIHERETATRLSVLAPDCPMPIEKLVHQLLAKDPADRIGTAQAFIKRIDHLLEEYDSKNTKQSDLAESEDEAFDVIEGPIDQPGTVGGNLVFDQPTAPADSIIPETAESSIGDELKLADADEPSPATIRNTGFTNVAKSREDYFTTVNPGHRRFEAMETEPEKAGPVWPYAVGLVGMFFGLSFLLWFVLAWRPSSDELYGQIVNTMEASENPREAEKQIQKFMSRFPDDPRIETIQEFDDQLNAAKLPRRIEQRARIRGAFALSPMERDFLAALKLESDQPLEAMARFQAIVDIYQDLSLDRHQQQCVIASRSQIRMLERVLAEDQALRRQDLEKALGKIESSNGSNPERTQQVCSGVIQLYQEAAWAEDLVARAKQMLEESKQVSTTEVDDEPDSNESEDDDDDETDN